jgi:protein-S-isoprenylcysteine O-methyltransferase Ste14
MCHLLTEAMRVKQTSFNFSRSPHITQKLDIIIHNHHIPETMEKKRYESRFIIVSLFVILILGIMVSLTDPSGIAGNGGSLEIYPISSINLSLFWIGLGMILLGNIIRWVAIATLKKNFSARLRIREGHTLVKNGIYHWIRHPAYLGLIIAYLGIPVMFSSMLGFLVMFLTIPLLIHRIKTEERMLIERFGAEYEEYMGHSKKLIPYIY